jgi:5'-nucleotidase / UDP-sugar diphosphatase
VRTRFFSLIAVLIILYADTYQVVSAEQASARKIRVKILHLNDIYEIAPVNGGKEGGLARVATIQKQLVKENPNLITTLGGDFLSPSALGLAKYKGKHLAGMQMVNVLNEIGLDYATFGNHEFDLNEDQFLARLAESEFSWISSNVLNSNGKRFEGVHASMVRSFSAKGSDKSFRVGIFGVTLDENKANYVSYADPKVSAGQELEKLKKLSDFQIALTHQSIIDDVGLVEAYPEIDLVLGGHEHRNYQRWRGDFTPILKADSNARTAYIVDLVFDPDATETSIKATLLPINEGFEEDIAVKKVVDQWVGIAFKGFREEGWDPNLVVTISSKVLDGLSRHVRVGPTNLTDMIAEALLNSYSEAELSIFNSGSIRIDDLLPAGKITGYDIIRVLPFKGQVQLFEIKGELLKRVLDQGVKNAGTGGFLQYGNIQRDDGHWMVNAEQIVDGRLYKAAINDYLVSGKERNLDYFTTKNPGLTLLETENRLSVKRQLIKYLKERGD